MSAEEPTLDTAAGPPGRLGRWQRLVTVLSSKPEKADPQKPRGIGHLNRTHLQHLFDAIRSEVKREDDLVNQRNTWCIIATTALVAGIGALTKATVIPMWLAGILMLTFSVAGLRLSYHCAKAVLAARTQIEYLFAVYEENAYHFLQVGLFRPFGRPAAHLSGIGYSLALPRIIFGVWSMILLASITFLLMEWLQ